MRSTAILLPTILVLTSAVVPAEESITVSQSELDEHVFIDEERTFPGKSWNGTGHEDLFDMAWGHKPVSAPMTSGGSEKFEEVNVKLFWNNPMTFRKSIRFNWELCFLCGRAAPRDARFASVVYWYGNP